MKKMFIQKLTSKGLLSDSQLLFSNWTDFIPTSSSFLYKLKSRKKQELGMIEHIGDIIQQLASIFF
jgi:hypothetical protein